MKSIMDLLTASTSDKQSVHRYGFVYDLLFNKLYHAKGRPLNVLEIGVSEYGSGSFNAFARSKMVGQIVGVDVAPYTSDLLDNMKFIQMDAYDLKNVETLEKDFGAFDLIIDDAVHERKHQEFILENYEKLLSHDGLIIIEDVSSLILINAQCANDNVFFIDGWGNLELGLNSYTDERLYRHNERLLIKSKSEKLTDHATHDSKPHIAKLPTQEFKDYDRTSTELAVSIPLFHPDLDNPQMYDKEKFQSVHCRGAIWAAMSFIHNTDLGENGVPIYFHVDEEVYHDALPVFDEFGVPKDWLKQMELPRYKDKVVKGSKKPLNGKILMALLDQEIDPDVLLILDSDLFTCVTGGKLLLYEKLTQPLLKRQPAMTYFHRKTFDYWWWVSVVMAAADFPLEMLKEKHLNEIEKLGYEKLGFEKELDAANANYDKVTRFYAENYLQTFPREHPTREYSANLISKTRVSPYPLSIWAEYNHPILELSSLLNVPTYDWEQDYIDAKSGKNCFAHIRVKKGRNEKFQHPSLISHYWDEFLADVSRHV